MQCRGYKTDCEELFIIRMSCFYQYTGMMDPVAVLYALNRFIQRNGHLKCEISLILFIYNVKIYANEHSDIGKFVHEYN